ncbi:ALPL [Branchiostoma lanceolatum]|uniref:ALPL protein n=1 Tax=Branchiostoma lanceolatum TaxID=7740 RepID=A0A8K0A3L9_BRALA|nr:ALPL [Branchiostoma lanceolatum]
MAERMYLSLLRDPVVHLFYGVHEQNYIAHVMQYAAYLGEYHENCHSRTGESQEQVIPALFGLRLRIPSEEDSGPVGVVFVESFIILQKSEKPKSKDYYRFSEQRSVVEARKTGRCPICFQ